MKSCEDALLKLDGKLKSLRKYSQPDGLRQKMRLELHRYWYPFRKDTLQTLRANVANIQERLKLALQVLQLDFGKETQELIQRLLNQTTIQNDSIARLEGQNQRILDT